MGRGSHLTALYPQEIDDTDIEEMEHKEWTLQSSFTLLPLEYWIVF
jgi:hypothetical protein